MPLFTPTNDLEFFVMGAAKENVMWGPLLEKAYAKFVGSYERLSKGGSSIEAMRAILGYHGFVYELAKTADVYLLIKYALE